MQRPVHTSYMQKEWQLADTFCVKILHALILQGWTEKGLSTLLDQLRGCHRKFYRPNQCFTIWTHEDFLPEHSRWDSGMGSHKRCEGLRLKDAGVTSQIKSFIVHRFRTSFLKLTIRVKYEFTTLRKLRELGLPLLYYPNNCSHENLCTHTMYLYTQLYTWISVF